MWIFSRQQYLSYVTVNQRNTSRGLQNLECPSSIGYCGYGLVFIKNKARLVCITSTKLLYCSNTNGNMQSMKCLSSKDFHSRFSIKDCLRHVKIRLLHYTDSCCFEFVNVHCGLANIRRRNGNFRESMYCIYSWVKHFVPYLICLLSTSRLRVNEWNIRDLNTRRSIIRMLTTFVTVGHREKKRLRNTIGNQLRSSIYESDTYH